MKQVYWKENFRLLIIVENLFVASFVVKESLPIYKFNRVFNTFSI